MRSRRWAERHELKRRLVPFGSEHGGPVLLDDDPPHVFCSEAHTLVLGITGMGKTSGFSIPLVLSAISSGENCVAMDPKGEVFETTARAAENAGYDVVFLDLRNPVESQGYSLFGEAYRLYHSSDPALRDRASGMLYAIADVLYKTDKNSDPYWEESARTLFIGLSLLAFETCPLEAITFNALQFLGADANTLLRAMTALPVNSSVRAQLKGYVEAPKDTRASTYAVFAEGLSKITRSDALSAMLTDMDGFEPSRITGRAKTLIYVTIPDENAMCAMLGSLIVEQISEYLIHLAHEFETLRLPIRWHFLIEELGSMARAFPRLPMMMTAGRSRGLRMHLILQSLSSLTKPYESDAETILANVGLIVVFRVFDLHTAEDFSKRVGTRVVDDARRIREEPLLRATDLLALPQYTALVIVDGSLCSIVRLRRYDELFDGSRLRGTHHAQTRSPRTLAVVLLKKYIDEFVSIAAKRNMERIAANGLENH
ncbi:type IV secretory pathway VirD4 component [Bifidobacterium pseudolongum subsp. globosum]|uniref:Type IV secretory pathway VirD4 component n=1 Tax=Bifidobacterium pseudolongum subsp. globosum TaxID=1690 RepID=A0A4Q5AEZ8_9BIFI|nr:type IV secretory system conjugative DNA transfer family protein [Bifidobacterium pseudolongum]RYQ26621.1 type IV secretory pathway VirD4 component [Bifidobacterium pseudolongum subsp. globosum]RYQ28613.1 type IV secretory pathway VirD4 component [Bifidobacterium pseudolongum subsp. globosum]